MSYSHAYLSARFSYDPATGVLTWLRRPRDHFETHRGFACFNSREAGTVAGAIQPNGYVAVRVDRKLLLAHRIAWVLREGRDFPTGLLIDHIDGDRANNRAENLRLATDAENARNRKAKTGTGLPKNVYFDSRSSRFWVSFTVNKKSIYAGRYNTLAEAEAAAGRLRSSLHGDFAHHGGSNE